jgi:hypothetical protein
MFSDKLSLNLLDATERGNFKWIDKTELWKNSQNH